MQLMNRINISYCKSGQQEHSTISVKQNSKKKLLIKMPKNRIYVQNKI